MFLKETREDIFLVICDMKMTCIDGLDLKRMIDQNPEVRKKIFPFIFVTMAETKEQITEAYNYRAQGYFKKPPTTNEQAEMLDIIIKYWIISIHPNHDGEISGSDKETAEILNPK
jgi:CheY-like chemotaxis protein